MGYLVLSRGKIGEATVNAMQMTKESELAMAIQQIDRGDHIKKLHSDWRKIEKEMLPKS